MASIVYLLISTSIAVSIKINCFDSFGSMNSIVQSFVGVNKVACVKAQVFTRKHTAGHDVYHLLTMGSGK